MSKLVFNEELGGTTTLQAQNTADNFVLNVPAADGTLIYNDTTGTAEFDNISLTGSVLAGTWDADTIDVAHGGTGAVTLTGYVKGAGTTAMTASATIPSTDITGLGTMSVQDANAVAITGGAISGISPPIPVASGGSGAATLTGYVKGNGTSAMTASATIPNTDITGLGTMSTQSADAVAITGGTADGLTVGAATPAAATVTTLRVNSTVSLAGDTGTTGQVLTSNGGSAPTWENIAGSGTVTSVDVSGGTTGLTTSGGPVTASGTITLAGTLAVANGGTGSTTAGDALTALGAYPASNPDGFTNNTGTVTDVTGSAPIASSGGTTPAISISQATTSTDGYLSSTDWNTFNNKTSNTGTVTSVGGTGTVNGLTLTGTVTTSGDLTLGGTLDLSSPPAIGGTAPAAGTFTTLSMNGGALSPQTGFKNRIINGAMTIDQRNAGASVTPTDTGGRPYCLDRWSTRQTQASKFSIQQSSTAPAGFINSTLITSLSAYTITTTDQFGFIQPIEGFNIADLGWGTANAQAVTLSFWVRSSLTGTFGGALRNSAADRSYPFTYTISAANTFEYKTITIAGDTSGTWLTTNGNGLSLTIGLGFGSTLSGTAGAWAAANYGSATGATSVVGTSGATFYITGVQLEKGSTATPFEFRSIGDELGLCQRYFQLLQNAQGIRAEAATLLNVPFSLSTMRAAPSAATFGTIVFRDLSGTTTRTANTPSAPSVSLANSTGGYLEISASSFSPSNFTAGNLVALACSTGLNGIAFSAEL